jgi:methylated-DNA-protein-cysteine methyltransferase-like protein
MNHNDKHKDFFEMVYDVVRLIPHGRVTNYGAIAAYLGTAKSSRMVGWAMNGAHSQKKQVPAHRVVNSIGMLTGKFHFQTITAMQEALEKENIIVEKDKIVHFKKHFWNPTQELML